MNLRLPKPRVACSSHAGVASQCRVAASAGARNALRGCKTAPANFDAQPSACADSAATAASSASVNPLKRAVRSRCATASKAAVSLNPAADSLPMQALRTVATSRTGALAVCSCRHPRRSVSCRDPYVRGYELKAHALARPQRDGIADAGATRVSDFHRACSAQGTPRRTGV